MKKLLLLGLLFAVTQSNAAEWVQQRKSFQYTLQEANRWWGCRNAEPQVRDFLEVLGARNIEISCQDRRNFPKVALTVNFQSVAETTPSQEECAASWEHFYISRNRYCSFFLQLEDQLSAAFTLRGKRLNAFCQGEEGSFVYQGERLSCAREP